MTVLNACIAGDLRIAEELLGDRGRCQGLRHLCKSLSCNGARLRVDHALQDAVKVRCTPHIKTMSMIG